MRSIISRWFMFGLLLGWAVAHATVFAQGTNSSAGAAQPGLPAAPGVKVGAMSADKLRQGLDKTISIDYTGQSLQEVLNHFRDRTGLAISVDQGAFMQMGLNGEIPMGPIEVKAKNEKASAVLRRLLNGHRLNYVILEDALLITTEEMALMRQMRQRVSVDVDEVPLKKAVQDLARKHGINLVIDPLIKQTADTPVSLQLDNTGAETALRLLAEMAHLKAVRMGNVMFITNETKAKMIRDEEQHQLDNPLNPNLPGFVPPIAAGGFGGGFGGIGGIMPPRIGIAPAAPVGPDGVVPPPPPGIDLPKAPPPVDQPPPAKKIIDLRNAPPLNPLPPPAVERPLQRALPIQRDAKDQ